MKALAVVKMAGFYYNAPNGLYSKVIGIQNLRNVSDSNIAQIQMLGD